MGVGSNLFKVLFDEAQFLGALETVQEWLSYSNFTSEKKSQQLLDETKFSVRGFLYDEFAC